MNLQPRVIFDGRPDKLVLGVYGTEYTYIRIEGKISRSSIVVVSPKAYDPSESLRDAVDKIAKNSFDDWSPGLRQ